VSGWLGALLVAWVVDRFEPPWAVLLSEDGRQRDVPLETLPAGAAPGDRLASPRGPVLARAAERARPRARRLAALVRTNDDPPSVPRISPSKAEPPPAAGALVSEGGVRHGAPMRRLQDHYGKKARREGFAARSIYKLEEIDRRVGLIKKGARVLDLGCAPGSWLQYAATATGPKGRVVGVDQRPVTVPLPEHVQVFEADVFGVDPATLGGRFDVVISDMAPWTSGNRFTDHVRSIELCRRALALAVEVLRPGGAFVCKVFEGEDVPVFVAEVRAHFTDFKRIKPKGTRTESVELYFVAQGFKGAVTETAAAEEGG
jgi:23S rRNA (uridine2552-2'-O)-methyltransferase